MARDRPGRKNYTIRKEATYTPAQWEMIQDRMKRCGYSDYSEYSRRMLIDGGILVVDDSKEIKELTYEINKIGVNINQIAHVANSTGEVSAESIKEVKDLMVTVWRLVRYILSGTPF